MSTKQILRFAKDEFIYGGHLISLGAVSAVFASAILLDIKITWDFLLIVYSIFYIIYSYNRLREFKIDFSTNSLRTGHLKKYIKYLPLVIFLYFIIATFLLLYFGNFKSIFFGFLILTLGLLYTIYFKKNTRKIVGFKSFYVSFVWALLVIFLIFYYSFFLNLSVIFIFIFIFLKCLIGTNFSDIKDIDSDKKEGLLTLATVYGEKKLIEFLNLINIFSVVLVVAGIYLNLLPIFSLMLVFTFFYSLYYFKKRSDEKIKSTILYSVIVDGEHIPWFILVLIGKFLIKC